MLFLECFSLMKKISNHLLLIILVLVISACNRDENVPIPGSHAAQAEVEVRVMADGWTPNLPYPAPEPGTYTLPKIGSAGGGSVLGVDGEVLELENFICR